MTSGEHGARIRRAEAGDLEGVMSLLGQVGLPTDGIRDHFQHFLVLDDGGNVAGVVGLEAYGRDSLLRSLAVSPGRQGRGDGRRLIEAVITHALRIGVETIYLLTETAAPFFERRGFSMIPRDAVPEAVKTSVEFTSCCPAAAVCMQMQVERPPASQGEAMT